MSYHFPYAQLMQLFLLLSLKKKYSLTHIALPYKQTKRFGNRWNLAVDR